MRLSKIVLLLGGLLLSSCTLMLDKDKPCLACGGEGYYMGIRTNPWTGQRSIEKMECKSCLGTGVDGYAAAVNGNQLWGQAIVNAAGS